MIRVLVAYATKSGSTASIAGAIADELRSCGVVAELVESTGTEPVPDPDGFHAVVLGSAGRRTHRPAAPVRTFGGRIDPAGTHGFMARRLVRDETAGDFRDFREIRQWARRIALAET